jgi:hypothetical protein
MKIREYLSNPFNWIHLLIFILAIFGIIIMVMNGLGYAPCWEIKFDGLGMNNSLAQEVAQRCNLT